MALLMGFTGSLHCAGMCGPIVWVMPFQMLNGIKKWLGIFLYHIGRISVYALFGFLLYSFRDAFRPEWQQYISIILGVTLLVAGIMYFLRGSFLHIQLPWANWVKNGLGHFIGSRGIGSLFVAGVLNGTLPCGMVYMALSAAISVSSAWQSAALMYVFGLGTMPMLIGLTVLKNSASFKFRLLPIRKLVPLTLFIFGSLFVLRGMNLGVPYISPKVVVAEHTIKACCCHKK
jgi:hypothetical protein